MLSLPYSLKLTFEYSTDLSVRVPFQVPPRRSTLPAEKKFMHCGKITLTRISEELYVLFRYWAKKVQIHYGHTSFNLLHNGSISSGSKNDP
ncbi:hypothetical protein PIB30_019463 [Stylosanthes scabra]|uniref:Uncharacterized protein n=1 Tax=Stylosanthes scabra TaxID=79078 RepID=A0ABU6S881_9FABA|nr:hypothetical protein [Stylosanthes scabra]